MPDSPETIGIIIADLARLFRQSFERAIAEEGLGLSAGEARTLFYAAGADGIRQAALAQRMRVEPMTLVNFLDKLEQRGLVTRDPDPDDRRAKRVSLTAAAEPLLLRVRTVAARVRAEACRGLPDAEVARARRALETMRQNLFGARDAST